MGTDARTCPVPKDRVRGTVLLATAANYSQARLLAAGEQEGCLARMKEVNY